MKRFVACSVLALTAVWIVVLTVLPCADGQSARLDVAPRPAELKDGDAQSDEPRVMTSEEFAREILRDLPALAREFGVELSDSETSRSGKQLVLIVLCKGHMDVPGEGYRNEVDESRIVDFFKDHAGERAEVAVLSAEPKRLFLNPTSTNLRAYLSMIAAAKPNVDVIVALLGDGVNFERQDYFIPDDGTFQDSANWVGLNEIESALRRSRARRTTILWGASRTNTCVAPSQRSTDLLALTNEAVESIDAVERVADRPANPDVARVRRVAFVCSEGGYGYVDEQGGDRGLQALLSEATSVDDFFGDALDALKERAQRRLDEGKVGQTLEVEGF